MSDRRQHVVIVGGGISGLAAAHRLQRLAGRDTLRVTLLESDDRLGGKIRTEQFAGRRIDSGPEAMLTRVAEAPALCRELGLEHELVVPASDQPYVQIGRRLRPLPPRLLAGVPGGVGAVMATRTLSPAGLARAGVDLVRPSRALEHDVSIGELVRKRLGQQVLERLIDPLLGGIHAGSCDELSVRATAPQLATALGSGHGLIRGLRAAAGGTPTAPARPPFVSLTGGLGGIVDALSARLREASVRTGVTVKSLEELAGGRVRLLTDDGAAIDADHVVLAVPAHVATGLLAASCPAAAGELARIDYASVATVLIAYPAQALAAPLRGTGFLVARGEGTTMTACTWSSAKWAHLSGDTILLKASAGRSGDDHALALDDAALVGRIHDELVSVMGLRARPADSRVVRFDRALPQYRVGHLERVARIGAALSALPSVQLAGAAYRGVGVGACIRDGQRAAAAIAAALGHATPTPSLTASAN